MIVGMQVDDHITYLRDEITLDISTQETSTSRVWVHARRFNVNGYISKARNTLYITSIKKIPFKTLLARDMVRRKLIEYMQKSYPHLHIDGFWNH